MGMKKRSGKALSLPAGIGFGIILSLLVTLLGAVVITQMVTTETIAQENMGFGIIVVLLVASIAGSWLSATQTKRLRLQVCLMEGAGYFVGLLATTALFFEGRYQGVWVSGILIIIGSLVTACIPLLSPKKVKIKKGAYR